MISPTTISHAILSKDSSSTNPTEEKLVAAVELFDSELKGSESESIDYGSLVSKGKESESESESESVDSSKSIDSEFVDDSKAKESESVNDDDQVILEKSLIDPNSMKTQENEGVNNVGKISSSDDDPPAEMVKPFTSVLKDDVKMFPEEGVVLEDSSKKPVDLSLVEPKEAQDPSLETSKTFNQILEVVSHVDELDGHQTEPVERLTTFLKERLCFSDELNTVKQIDTVPADENDCGFDQLVKKEAADTYDAHCETSKPITNVEMKSQLAKTTNVEIIKSLAKMRPKRQTRRPTWLNDFVLGKP